MIKTSHTSEVAAVLKAFPGSSIVLEILYLPSGKTMQDGYDRLRSILAWCLKQEAFAGRALPEEAAEVMRWLRDHFGPDDARKAAIEKYGAPKDPTRPTALQLAMAMVKESNLASGNADLPWDEEVQKRKEVATKTAEALLRRLDIRLPARSSALTAASTSKDSGSSSANPPAASTDDAMDEAHKKEEERLAMKDDQPLVPTELVHVGPEKVEVTPPKTRAPRAKKASAAPQATTQAQPPSPTAS